ncbi:MAG TPA: transposase [Thermoanaerobaculaceae bacterium]|nr:transposase [Thermoanaerobaculaceae bacterium]HQU34918.1 transposase [Thermoanaerobaculaceae bacterium]
MARKPRLHVPGGLYHVMLRGNGGQAIFTDDADRLAFCDLLADGVERFGHRIHAYCLMPNHVHLAIRVSEMPLSRIVQNLAFRFTRAFNRRAHRVGHLFQGRFRSLLVDADAYLLELVRYVHLNPVRAGLVHDPSDWAWSGHRTYLGRDHAVWLDTGFVLGIFDERDVRRARRRYAGFVREGLGETYREELHHGDADPRVWGDEAFLGDVLGAPPTPGPTPQLKAIIAAVCAAWNTDEAALRSSGRQREPARTRAAIGWLGIQMGAATLSQIAVHFRRDIATMSRQVGRLVADARRDQALAAQLAGLRHRLE